MDTPRHGGPNPPAITIGNPIPPGWQRIIVTAARMVAARAWHSAGEPDLGNRGAVRAEAMAVAREALGFARLDMEPPPDALVSDLTRPESAEPMPPPSYFLRSVIARCDHADPIVAESIMAMIERAMDDQLSQPYAGRRAPRRRTRGND